MFLIEVVGFCEEVGVLLNVGKMEGWMVWKGWGIIVETDWSGRVRWELVVY